MMRTDLPRLSPDATLGQALELFLQADLPALPVVEGQRFLAMIRHGDISRGYLRELHSDG
jgi:CBS domain-containing protein